MNIKKIFTFCSLLFIVASMSSCDQISEILDTQLTEEEVVAALKEALTVGTDTSVNTVSSLDGFYKDAAIKILLPPEADEVIQKLRSTGTGEAIYQTALDPLAEQLILSLNRSAEDAAGKAAPIFKDAILGITIEDGFAILNGADNEATVYLENRTSSQLYTAFQPDIETSLDKGLVGGESASSLYARFVNTYNDVASSPANILLGLETINDNNLSAYVTQKGLDGLFVKVAEEEKDIRTNVGARVTALLEKVFGSLD